VTSPEFVALLRTRAQESRITLHDSWIPQLESFLRLLTTWNERINLTGLSVANPNASTIDRLLLEPLAAAHLVPQTAASWIDVGSGGGSPAIPMKIAHPRLQLTMFEARERKSAFLREAVRILGLRNVDIQRDRLQEAAPRFHAYAHLVTIRGVRIDDSLLRALRDVLHKQGRIFLFGSNKALSANSGLQIVAAQRLVPTPGSLLTTFVHAPTN